MPGFVRTKKDEKNWSRAKQAAGKKQGGETKWALANYIYQRMKSMGIDLEKCAVDPELVKSSNVGMQQYAPVVFQQPGKIGPHEKEAEKKDFPSTPKALDLTRVIPPDFPSSAETGKPIAAAFGSPEGQSNDKSWNGPDIQRKGSDFPNKNLQTFAKKSFFTVAGRTIRLIKAGGDEGSRNGNLGAYPIDATEEKQKREAFIQDRAMKDKVKAHEENKKYAGNSELYVSTGPDAYLGRSVKITIEKGNKESKKKKNVYEENLGNVIDKYVGNKMYGGGKRTARFAQNQSVDTSGPAVRKFVAEHAKSAISDMTKGKERIGEYRVKSPDDTTVYKRAPIDPNKPHEISLIHYSPEAIRKREERAKRKVKKSSVLGQLIELWYTQNQPLAAGLKPLIGVLVKKDDKEKDKTEKSETPKAPKTSEEIHEKIIRETKKPEGPKIRHKKWTRPELGPDALPIERQSHDPDFDSWAREYNRKFKSEYPAPVGGKTGRSEIALKRTFSDPSGTGQKDEGWDEKEEKKEVSKGEVIDFAAAKAKKEANEKSGVKKLDISSIKDWSNIKMAPTKRTPTGTASQHGDTTLHTPYYRSSEGRQPETTAYGLDRKKGQVVVSKEEKGKPDFKVTKKIPASASHEEDLKNASMMSIIDSIMEKAKGVVGERTGTYGEQIRDYRGTTGKRERTSVSQWGGENPTSVVRGARGATRDFYAHNPETGEVSRRSYLIGSKNPDKPDVEGVAVSNQKKLLRLSHPNPIDGGIGDDLEYKDVDPKELEAGIEVEQEHVGNDPNIDDDEKRVKGADIAMDHLKEDPNYYTHLQEMERQAKEENKSETQKKKLLAVDEATKSIPRQKRLEDTVANAEKMVDIREKTGAGPNELKTTREQLRAYTAKLKAERKKNEGLVKKALTREERDPSSKVYRKYQRQQKEKFHVEPKAYKKEKELND